VNRRVSLFLSFMILALVYSGSALTQNWTFKDAVVSNEGTYTLTENGTLAKLAERERTLWEIKIPPELHVHLASAPEGVLLVGGVLAKLDGNGNLLWAKSMSVDNAVALPDGSVIFVSDNTLGLLNSDGTTVWARQLVLNGTNESLPEVGIHLKTVTPLHDTLLVTGIADLPGDPKSHLFLGAFSLNGTLLWAKVLNTDYYDRPDKTSPFGDYVVITGVYGGGSDAPWIADYFALKISSDGEIEWFNSYICPRREDWDDFWSMKVLGLSCNKKICVLGTTTGTFVLDTNETSPIYLNVSGKVTGIVNDSALILSNGTLLTIPLNQSEGTEKCYTVGIPFREIPVKVEIHPTKFSAPDAPLQVLTLQRTNRQPKIHSEKQRDGQEYFSVVLLIAILIGTALMLAKREP